MTKYKGTAKAYVVTGVHVHANAHSDRWHVYCAYKGAQYHVAINRRTSELEPDAAKGTIVTLYKNPLPVPDEKNLGQSKYLRPSDPGYFRAVHLDANGATGRIIIPMMLAGIKPLIEAAEAKLAAEAQAEQARDRKNARDNRITAAAAEMYELVKDMANMHAGAIPIRLRAIALVKKVEGE